MPQNWSAWTTYTPTLSATSSAPTLGTGSTAVPWTWAANDVIAGMILYEPATS